MIDIKLDISQVVNLPEQLQENAKAALNKAAQILAIQAHAHLIEQANDKLHSSRDTYINALTFDQLDDTTWLIHLGKEAMWIEDGMDSFDMKKGLLASPKAKTAIDGSKYMAVPFNHSKSTGSSPAQAALKNALNNEMKKRGIPNTIEKNQDGSPKLGLLHSFDANTPIKTNEGPGQGKGPIGQARQGKTGIPFLNNVRIYQRMMKNPVTGQNHVVKNVMTFRTVSSKQGADMWIHPGVEARKLMDETAEWALREWDSKIAPQILADVINSI